MPAGSTRSANQAQPRQPGIVDQGYSYTAVRSTYDILRAQSEELRTSLAAHSQWKQGIVVRPEKFIGPVPKTFPDTNASLLLVGATNAADALQQLLERLSLNDSDEGVVTSEDVSVAAASGSPPIQEAVGAWLLSSF